jgi:hypothetical protein
MAVDKPEASKIDKMNNIPLSILFIHWYFNVLMFSGAWVQMGPVSFSLRQVSSLAVRRAFS